jgi:hypothetical protein
VHGRILSRNKSVSHLVVLICKWLETVIRAKFSQRSGTSVWDCYGVTGDAGGARFHVHGELENTGIVAPHVLMPIVDQFSPM